MKPRLLDLFCGAGGAAWGYHQAGFDVVGVDIRPQPNYPFEFWQLDALQELRRYLMGDHYLGRFDAIHASPPCQAFTAYKRTGNVGEYPDLIQPVRELLDATGLPYVIENVENAPLKKPVLLCGSQFDELIDIRRHRIFETNWPLQPHMWPCRHKLPGVDRFPGGRSVARGGVSTALVRGTMEIGSWDTPLAKQKEAMGIGWDVTLEELSEAIPPAYTEYIGTQLHKHVLERNGEFVL